MGFTIPYMGFPISYLNTLWSELSKYFRFFNNTKNAKVTLEAWESTLKIFQNSIFSIFFNIGTHFMSKQHVWDHFQQNFKFLIFSPKKTPKCLGLSGKILKNFQKSIFQLFSTLELVSCQNNMFGTISKWGQKT